MKSFIRQVSKFIIGVLLVDTTVSVHQSLVLLLLVNRAGKSTILDANSALLVPSVKRRYNLASTNDGKKRSRP